MEYLVECHMGGHYVSSDDPEVIEEYCEQCGDHDRIILSWKENEKMDTLLKYFFNIKMSSEQLENEKMDSIETEEELVDYLTWEYEEDINLINELADDVAITREEQLKLLKQVKKCQRKQFELLKSIYHPNSFVKIKK